MSLKHPFLTLILIKIHKFILRDDYQQCLGMVPKALKRRLIMETTKTFDLIPWPLMALAELVGRRYGQKHALFVVTQ